MPSTCVFEFDRAEPIYYGGETVKGRILLHTTKNKIFREIYIQFLGEAKTHWAVHKAVHIKKKRLHYTVTYKGQETYIHSHKTLFTGEEIVLPPGVHEYSFSVALPNELPSSCEEVYGQINYSISLVIDRTERFNNIFLQPLTVLRQFDLNQSLEVQLPLTADDVIYFCCWPCKSGPVKSILTIPFGGYAPGQDINFSLHVTNKSKMHDVKEIKLRFIQTYTFISRTPRVKIRKHSVTLAEIIQDETIFRSKEATIRNCIKVPAVPPTTQGKFIVAVAYHIEMVFGTTCRSYSKIEIPVTIGTVPLVQSIANSEYISIPLSSGAPDTPNVQTSTYQMRSPPSYEESTTITERFLDIDADEHSRIKGFLPKYPMYSSSIFIKTAATQYLNNQLSYKVTPI